MRKIAIYIGLALGLNLVFTLNIQATNYQCLEPCMKEYLKLAGEAASGTLFKEIRKHCSDKYAELGCCRNSMKDNEKCSKPQPKKPKTKEPKKKEPKKKDAKK